QTILELSFWIRTPVNWQVQHFKLSSWRSRNKLEIFSAAIFSHEASSSGDVSCVNPMPKAWPILTLPDTARQGSHRAAKRNRGADRMPDQARIAQPSSSGSAAKGKAFLDLSRSRTHVPAGRETPAAVMLLCDSDQGYDFRSAALAFRNASGLPSGVLPPPWTHSFAPAKAAPRTGSPSQSAKYLRIF